MAKAITHLGEIVEVDDDLMGIVHEIHTRWPDLRVKYLDPERFPDITDSPYIIEDSHGRKVMGVWQLDRRVIEQLALRDESTHNLKKLFETEVEKAKKKKEAVEAEKRAEVKDKMEHIFKSPKGSYTVPTEDGKIVRISDG